MSWLPEALAKLKRCAALEYDWDSRGALPPSHDAVSAANVLLHYAANAIGIEIAPDICAAPYGGIDIEWAGPQGSLNIRVWESGLLDLKVYDQLQEQQFSANDLQTWLWAATALRRKPDGLVK